MQSIVYSRTLNISPKFQRNHRVRNRAPPENGGNAEKHEVFEKFICKRLMWCVMGKLW